MLAIRFAESFMSGEENKNLTLLLCVRVSISTAQSGFISAFFFFFLFTPHRDALLRLTCFSATGKQYVLVASVTFLTITTW